MMDWEAGLIDTCVFVWQSLLTHVSRSTKNTLNRLGVFTVSSFHAYICARSPSLLNNLLAGRGATRRRAVAPVLSRSNSLSSRKSQSIGGGGGGATSHAAPGEADKLFKVNLPDGQVSSIPSFFHSNSNISLLICYIFWILYKYIVEIVLIYIYIIYC